jgi:integrase
VSIYRRKGSPHWWISISVAGRKTRRTTGTSDRAQAQEFEKRERDRLWKVHKLGDTGYIRWSEAAARWLSEIPEASRKKELSVLNALSESLEHEPLRAIDREAVQVLRELCLAEGRSRSTVDRHMAILRAVLNKCVEWGYLETTPAVPMFNVKRGDFRWLTHTEFDALCKHLPEHLALAAHFSVLTGLRMRSMLKLTWDRIDLARCRLWVPGIQMKGKNAHGMPITREVAKLLRKLKTLNPSGAHIFQYQGEPIDDCNTKAFQKAVEASGVGPLRWHDLRHTFASWAVQNGVTLQELMQLGGWKTFASVLRYAHLAPDHLAKAASLVRHSGHSRKRRFT